MEPAEFWEIVRARDEAAERAKSAASLSGMDPDTVRELHAGVMRDKLEERGHAQIVVR